MKTHGESLEVSNKDGCWLCGVDKSTVWGGEITGGIHSLCGDATGCQHGRLLRSRIPANERSYCWPKGHDSQGKEKSIHNEVVLEISTWIRRKSIVLKVGLVFAVGKFRQRSRGGGLDEGRGEVKQNDERQKE